MKEEGLCMREKRWSRARVRGILAVKLIIRIGGPQLPSCGLLKSKLFSSGQLALTKKHYIVGIHIVLQDRLACSTV